MANAIYTTTKISVDPPAILVLNNMTLVRSSSTLLSNHPPHSCCIPLVAVLVYGVTCLVSLGKWLS